jgi:two-component system nitrogen regulation response regulator GlnG
LDLTYRELHKNVHGFAEPAIQTLLNYPWPGNVRQLRSTIRRSVLLADTVVTESHLDILQENGQAAYRVAPPAWVQAVSTTNLSLKEIVAQSTTAVEREVLLQTLRTTGGNKAKAARLLHIDYKTIQSKVKKYGVTQNQEAL